MFHLLGKFDFEKAYISDLNPELILCYRTLQRNAKGVSRELLELLEAYPDSPEDRSVVYYSNRDSWNESVGKLDQLGDAQKVRRAAMTIFLNKTCFNGLFRVNSSGGFNVPIGGYEKISIPGEGDLLTVQESLEGVEIRHCSFTECEPLVEKLGPKSLVYFDPPYRKVSKTSFVSYSKEDFGDSGLTELTTMFRRLDDRGARLMLSNSDGGDGYFDELFEGYEIETVQAKRSINRRGGERGRVPEVLIRNY